MSALLVAWFVAATLFTLVAVVRTRRLERPVPGSARRDGVLVVRPCEALAAHELEALRESVPGTVASPTRPPLDGQWVSSEPRTANRKMGHLLNAIALGAPPIVVSADADVVLDAALIDSLVAALEGGASLAWAAPVPREGRGLAAKTVRGLLVQSHHSFRALEAMAVGAQTVCGKAVAFGPDALALLPLVANVVGEDLELSKLLHARGLRVALVAVDAQVVQAQALTLEAVVSRFTRWMQVLRAHRGALFPSVPLLFAVTPLALVAAVASGSFWVALAALGLFAARCGLATGLERRSTHRSNLHLAWLLAEVMLLVCCCNAVVVGRRVVWRGRAYTVGIGGTLS